MTGEREPRKKLTPREALIHIMKGMRDSGAGAAPGPVDSFKFGGVVWWRLETPGGNSMIVGLPDTPTKAAPKRKAKR